MKKITALAIVALVVVGVIFGVKWAKQQNLTAKTAQTKPVLTDENQETENNKQNEQEGNVTIEQPTDHSNSTPTPSPTQEPEANHTEEEDPDSLGESITVIAEPESIAALVNPNNRLPDQYEPTDLVYPDVRFIFAEKLDKRKLRKEAATALEEMFVAAEEDGYYLAGVSGYRSREYQKQLFNRYVAKDGVEKAKTYSAYPGTSEHETGLAMDVTRSDGKCAASDCFGDMDEATWIAKYAHQFGFIVRYPEGKQNITGYKYEPWHLRYVGIELAEQLNTNDQTLEEYYDAVPVSR
ncbi:M15 family metallopeptidase [Paenibacillus yanchengensis]|uniref:M15 family metallopeptidase n=1 Tax=Paenibacillus yanchengensis TaxID=2035833 RepID=A0ABW4YP64_9BACL